MSKPNAARRKDNEAFAIGRHIRGSERKLNLVAGLIRGKPVQKALVDLEFSRRRMSNEVKKILESAIANAENNHGLDVDRLFVKTATVGRTLTMRRFKARARGRSSAIEKPFSNITIFVEERAADAPKKKVKKAKADAGAKKAPAKKKESAKKEGGKKEAASKGE
ncbi:MAG: 50S ribosomal protein L22 [Alphaproteobacteria bacterium]|nr:50S ribosomal protein L22 [Alphaproteobacteria bacterium]